MCFDCLDFLENCPITVSSPLIKAHDRGRLMHPSHCIDRVVKVTHKILKPLLRKHIFKEKNIINRMCSSVLLSLNATQPEILANLDEHVESKTSHKVSMLKKIVSIYVSLRLKHFCRETNNNVLNKMIRTKLTRSILFQGQ